jgi:hypothetical protein
VPPPGAPQPLIRQHEDLLVERQRGHMIPSRVQGEVRRVTTGAGAFIRIILPEKLSQATFRLCLITRQRTTAS